MRAPWLRRLDDRWLPRWAGTARRLTGRLRRPPGPTRQLTRSAFEREPALAGSIASVLVAALLVAVLGGDRTADRGSAATPVVEPSLPPAPPALSAVIGPARGASVATYLVRAAYDLRHFGDIGSGRVTFALVDLRSYSNPGDLATVFDGVQVTQVYARVPSPLPTGVHKLPLHSLDGLAASMRGIALLTRTGVRNYRIALKALRAGHSSRGQVRVYHQRLRAQRVEARAYANPAGCRCVFAVVVQAGIDRLAALARLPAVRVVDPAPPEVPLGGLTFCPLQPQVTTTVPAVDTCAG
ncbi:MAG: hypothetical protein JO222_15175 [Frankiales bacterium]|nr:hypothetical protein [Frankiales bacterium]